MTTPINKFSKLQLFFGVLAAIGALIVLFLLADMIILPIYTKQGAEIQLPDIVEKSAEEAEAVLEKQGFRMIIDGSEYHPVLPESIVVFQNPAPYTHVKRGRRIYVHISAGERSVLVPRIIGISERDAKLQLLQAGLAVGEIEYRVSSYPKDVVCSQNFPADTEVTEKTEISFSVSLGRSKSSYTVPDVLGIQLNEAISKIKKEGLKVGKIQKEIRDEFIPDTVVEQYPEPGTKVQAGDQIRIIVSALSDPE